MFTQNRTLAEFGQTLEGYTLGDMYSPRIGNGGEVVFRAGVFGADEGGYSSKPTRTIPQRRTEPSSRRAMSSPGRRSAGLAVTVRSLTSARFR
jgi:hypothetical protein